MCLETKKIFLCQDIYVLCQKKNPYWTMVQCLVDLINSCAKGKTLQNFKKFIIVKTLPQRLLDTELFSLCLYSFVHNYIFAIKSECILLFIRYNCLSKFIVSKIPQRWTDKRSSYNSSKLGNCL
jgi:hypothetical protein